MKQLFFISMLSFITFIAQGQYLDNLEGTKISPDEYTRLSANSNFKAFVADCRAKSYSYPIKIFKDDKTMVLLSYKSDITKFLSGKRVTKGSQAGGYYHFIFYNENAIADSQLVFTLHYDELKRNKLSQAFHINLSKQGEIKDKNYWFWFWGDTIYHCTYDAAMKEQLNKISALH